MKISASRSFCLILASNILYLTQGTPLLSKSIVTPTDVNEQALLALDLRDIHEALEQKDFDTARTIYINGRNSVVFDSEGNQLEEKRNFRHMSIQSLSGSFDHDPTFMFHTYGLSGAANVPPEEGHKEKLKEAYTYSNDFTGDLLADTLTGTLSVESMIALNLWMFVTHELWHSISECASATYERLDEFELQHANAKGARSFDEVIAYWVGQDQSNGDDDGYSLYALTQRAGKLFGTADPEAQANTKIKRLYEEGRALLSMQGACSTNTDTLEKLWAVANNMISKMMIPLIQMLIQALTDLDFYRIQLYSIAVIPQLSTCKRSTFIYLKQQLLDEPYKPSTYDSVIEMLQSSYECLGLSCSDIGTYGADTPTCKDTPKDAPLAGYTPTADVRAHSLIDLDLYQFSVMARIQIYDKAILLYQFGKNVYNEDQEKYDSLEAIATRTKRREVIWFNEYAKYFDDEDYADTIIRNALLGDGKWGRKGDDERHAIISVTARYQITQMAVLVCLQMAIEQCQNNDYKGAEVMWDQAAAYLIGSLEGTLEGGASIEDGQLIWNLANSLCSQFNTCNNNGYSKINGDLLDFFYSGKGELNAGDCTNLLQTSRKIEKVMIVPMIQGVLKYAMRNERRSDIFRNSDLASGEAMALCVLPIIQLYDPESAEKIEKNMIFQEGVRPAASGAVSIGDAFAPLMEDLDIRCDYVGYSDKVDACDGFGNSSAPISDVSKVMMKTMLLVMTATVLIT